MGSVVLVQTALPDYRQAALDQLRPRLGDQFRIYAGRVYFTPTVVTGVELNGSAHPLENTFLFGRRLLWQRGALRAALHADVAVFELNPRVLSTWVSLLTRRAIGRKSLLWGHAWPRRGRTARTDSLRNGLRRLANGLIVHTETEARELRHRMPGASIVAAPNAIYPRASFVGRPPGAVPREFLFVGRLVHEKKPDLLLQAFAVAASRLPEAFRLTFVGDGPLRHELAARSQELGVATRVTLTGHVADYARLQEFYARALASVSPGYVGLALTQSLSFGVPMIIARDEPHAPEVEAATEGFNSLFFDSDSAHDLAAALLRIVDESEKWLRLAPAIAEDAASRYSVELMVDRIASAVNSDE
jgi:glycosyltransferase involved in cell wall biosynthesis